MRVNAVWRISAVTHASTPLLDLCFLLSVCLSVSPRLCSTCAHRSSSECFLGAFQADSVPEIYHGVAANPESRPLDSGWKQTCNAPFGGDWGACACVCVLKPTLCCVFILQSEQTSLSCQGMETHGQVEVKANTDLRLWKQRRHRLPAPFNKTLPRAVIKSLFSKYAPCKMIIQ